MPPDVECLFRQHHEPLFRYLVRLTGDEEMAAEATQEAFVRMIEDQPEDRHPRAWLYTVATNFVRETARTRNRRDELLEESGHRLTPEREPAPDEAVEAGRRTDRARRALDGLRERDRVILLMQAEGFAHREIADAVGTTTGSVGTMLARALDRFREALDTPSNDNE